MWVGEATVWIPKVDPEMENAEKKKTQRAQPILLCRQRKRPPRREGRRKMEAGEDKGRKESRRRGVEEEEHGRQTFPAQSTRAESSEVGVGMGQQRR
jgi:hypothetical protein